MRGAIRLLAWCLAIALVALPVVGVLRGWFAANRWPVTRLTVQAEFKHVGAEQIRAAILPRLGRGFFALDLDAVQKAVAALPWVESVEARKRWPDTLILRVYERQPFARWNDKQLISRQGQVFDAPQDAEAAGLPALRGPDARLAEVVSFYAEAQRPSPAPA
jgi:cell division protein FtsQ